MTVLPSNAGPSYWIILNWFHGDTVVLPALYQCFRKAMQSKNQALSKDRNPTRACFTRWGESGHHEPLFCFVSGPHARFTLSPRFYILPNVRSITREYVEREENRERDYNLISEDLERETCACN